MQIKAEDLVEMLKKMDEAESGVAAAFDTFTEEAQEHALEKMRELRAMLYAALAVEQETQTIPCPVTYPVITPLPWWEQFKITCTTTGTGATEAE